MYLARFHKIWLPCNPQDQQHTDAVEGMLKDWVIMNIYLDIATITVQVLKLCFIKLAVLFAGVFHSGQVHFLSPPCLCFL